MPVLIYMYVIYKTNTSMLISFLKNLSTNGPSENCRKMLTGPQYQVRNMLFSGSMSVF